MHKVKNYYYRISCSVAMVMPYRLRYTGKVKVQLILKGAELLNICQTKLNIRRLVLMHTFIFISHMVYDGHS